MDVKKSRIVVIVVLLVVAGLLVAGYVVRGRLKKGRSATTVRVEAVERGTLTEFVSAPGEIEPRTKVEISAKVSARIVELPCKEGDRVTAGDPNADLPIPPSILVKLDSRDLESQLRSAKAAYAAQAAQKEVEKARIASQQATLTGLEASLAQAQTDLRRQEALLRTKDIAQADYDQAKLRLDDLTAQLAAARHTLEAAELNLTVLEHNLEAADACIEQAQEALSYTTITSPIDGVVTRINAEVGEVVIFGTMNNPGTVIMEVGDLAQMLVVAQVDEADVGKLAVGQAAVVHIDAYPDREFSGRVHSIALAHTLSFTRTKYYETEILLDPSDIRLHTGLTANVDIETRTHENVLKAPTQAVLGRDIDALPLEIRDKNPLVDTTKTFATVVYRFENGKALATPVKIGRSDLSHTIILEGLSDGEKIIVGPFKVLDGLKHNQAVKDERDTLPKKKPDGKDGSTTTGDANEPNDPNGK